MGIKHAKTSVGTDNGNPGHVQPNDWNADHVMTGMLALLDGLTPSSDTVLTINTAGQAELFPKSSILSAVDANLTGNARAPTVTTSDNSQRIATTAFVQAVVSALIAAAPGALNTLDELAAAMGDDANFATTMTNALALKAPLASPALTGNPTVPNQTALTNNTRAANTAYADAAVAALSALIAAGSTAAAGAVVASSLTQQTSTGPFSTLIPVDDTIPSISEGDQILTANHTPKSVTNKLRVTVRGQVSNGAGDNVVVAVFQGSTCIGAQVINVTAAQSKHAFHVVAEYTPGAVTSQTISVRIGGGAIAVHMNGSPSVGRLLGGASSATMLIEEVKA